MKSCTCHALGRFAPCSSCEYGLAECNGCGSEILYCDREDYEDWHNKHHFCNERCHKFWRRVGAIRAWRAIRESRKWIAYKRLRGKKREIQK